MKWGFFSTQITHITLHSCLSFEVNQKKLSRALQSMIWDGESPTQTRTVTIFKLYLKIGFWHSVKQMKGVGGKLSSKRLVHVIGFFWTDCDCLHKRKPPFFLGSLLQHIFSRFSEPLTLTVCIDSSFYTGNDSYKTNSASSVRKMWFLVHQS